MAATMADLRKDPSGGVWIKAHDGLELYVKQWKPDTPAVASVVFIHGMGEHINRYNHVFDAFVQVGIAVTGFDQRGCGRSDGLRGDYGYYSDVMADVRTVWDYAYDAKVPQFIAGHSLGGLHCLSFAALHAKDLKIAGVIASAPALQPAFQPPWIVVVVGRMLKGIPGVNTLRVATALNLENLSHDPKVGEEYVKDPYNIFQVSLRSGAGFLDQGNLMIARGFTDFYHPLLLTFGDKDQLTSLPHAKEWFAKLPSKDKTLKIYEDWFHELHNEVNKEDAIKVYADWILLHAKADPSTA